MLPLRMAWVLLNGLRVLAQRFRVLICWFVRGSAPQG